MSFQVKKRAGCRNITIVNNNDITSSTDSDKIRACYFNARSLRNKFNELQALVYLENYDIIGITETWINSTRVDYLAEYALPGYDIFCCERTNRSGGGVMFYIKSNLNPRMIPTPNIANINITFTQIESKRKKIMLGLIYRPPAQSNATDEKLYDIIADICSVNNCVIMGDFNLPVTRWGEPITAHAGQKLYQCLIESSLHQHVKEPTRGNNILDIILTTDENLVKDVEIGPEFSTSDHGRVLFTINFDKGVVSESKEKIPDYRRANYARLRSQLASINWKEQLATPDVNKAWQVFAKELKEATNLCVPLRNRRKLKNTKPKWWNNDIRSSLLAKKKAYHKYKLTQNNNDKLEHDRLRRQAKKLIRSSKKTIEAQIAKSCKTNPKAFYSYVKSKRVSTSTIGPLITEDGKQTENDTDMANTLNEYFSSVFTTENVQGSLPTPLPQSRGTTLPDFTITESEVLSVMNSMNVNKTPGPDKVSPRLLKEARSELTEPLTILFNKTLVAGKVPHEWKQANVTPIFKKGDKSLPANYRPISLTSVACKLMETILRDKIVKYLEENKILNDSQHGFRNKRSCLTNLLDFFYEVFNSYDETRAVDIIYLDFQKAFDTVPHRRLISKVKAHGIAGNTLKWLTDWLSDRQQRVVINGKESAWHKVHSGVPQGSVLGPILFIIYINDIDEGVTCKISKFADDTKITSKVTSVSQWRELQCDLDKLTSWAETWQMKFNIEKCKVLHIGNDNAKARYEMNNVQLSSTEKEKDLGVTVSKDLKPSQHCTETIKKANKLVGFIGRTFEFKSEKVILALYNSLVRPHLEYCVQFWSPYYKKDIEKLEKIQRRVTKMIPRLRNKSYEERLEELNLFSLPKRRIRGDLIEVFKIFKGFSNLDANKYFTIDHSNLTRNNGFKIIPKRFQSHEAKYFFFNRIVNVWNKLPSEVVNSNSIESFKNKVDKYLKDNPQQALFLSE